MFRFWAKVQRLTGLLPSVPQFPDREKEPSKDKNERRGLRNFVGHRDLLSKPDRQHGLPRASGSTDLCTHDLCLFGRVVPPALHMDCVAVFANKLHRAPALPRNKHTRAFGPLGL